MSLDLNTVCRVLDKLTLEGLRLMEDYIALKLKIENCMNAGESNLVKSRYILGQQKVSALQIPSDEDDVEPSAVVVDKDIEAGLCKTMLELEIREVPKNQNPLRWFGVLLPQSMHQAQASYKQTLELIIECANVQRQLNETCNKIKQLKICKAKLKQ